MSEKLNIKPENIKPGRGEGEASTEEIANMETKMESEKECFEKDKIFLELLNDSKNRIRERSQECFNSLYVKQGIFPDDGDLLKIELEEKEFFLNQLINNPDKYNGLSEDCAQDIFDFLGDGIIFNIENIENIEKILFNEKMFPKLPKNTYLIDLLINTDLVLGHMIINNPERFGLSLEKDLIQSLISGDVNGRILFLKYYKKFKDLKNKEIHEILLESYDGRIIGLLIEESELFGTKFDKDFFERLIIIGQIELAAEVLEKKKEELKLSREEVISIIKTYIYSLPNPLILKSVVPALMNNFNLTKEDIPKRAQEILFPKQKAENITNKQE